MLFGKKTKKAIQVTFAIVSVLMIASMVLTYSFGLFL